LVLIPTFAVPSSIILHALSLRQLYRIGRREAPIALPVRRRRRPQPSGRYSAAARLALAGAAAGVRETAQ